MVLSPAVMGLDVYMLQMIISDNALDWKILQYLLV